MDLYLTQPGLDQLHRIFDGDHIHFRGGHLPQHRVEGRGLAAPGRTGDQQEPLAPAEHRAEAGVFVFGQAQLFEGGDQRGGVEHAEHGLFPEHRGQGRDSQFDLLPALDALEPPVLGTPLLRDVETAQHLDAADHGAIDDPREGVHGAQHAVHPESDDRAVPLRFQMDVGGSLFEGLSQDRVERRDHRPRGGFEVVVGVRFRHRPAGADLLRAAVLPFELGLRGAERGPQVVETAVDALDVRSGGDHHLHLDPQIAFEIVYGGALVRVRHGDGQGAPVLGERTDGVPPGEGRRKSAGHHFRIQFRRIDRAEGKAHILRGGLGDVFFGDDPFRQQSLLVRLRRHRADAGGGPIRPGGNTVFPAQQFEDPRDRGGAGNRLHRGASAWTRCAGGARSGEGGGRIPG